MGSLADPLPINAAGESMGRILFVWLVLFGGWKAPIPLNAPRTPASSPKPPVGASAAPSPAPLRKSSTRGQLHGRGHSRGQIATKTAILKTSLRRYLTDVDG